MTKSCKMLVAAALLAASSGAMAQSYPRVTGTGRT
jgi:hypothetical protein